MSEPTNREPERRYARRAMLLGTAGAGILAATVVAADPASATVDPVALGQPNISTTTTSIATADDHCFEATTAGASKSAIYATDESTAGGNGVFAQSTNGWGVSAGTTGDTRSAVIGHDTSKNGGYGVTGTSVEGVGVAGSSTNSTGVQGITTGDGRYAVLGLDNGSKGGVGVGGESVNGQGVAGYTGGKGMAGVFGEDLSSSGGYGVSGTSSRGVGVLAASVDGVALSVEGIARFSRSGRARVAGRKTRAASSVVVKNVTLSASSTVLATPQTYEAGVAVAGVVLDAKTKSFTIHLTKAVKKSFTIGWFILD